MSKYNFFLKLDNILFLLKKTVMLSCFGVSFIGCSPIKTLDTPKLDYSFLSDYCQENVSELHKYILIHKKSKRYIIPSYTSLKYLSQINVGKDFSCINYLSAIHIKDIFGKPTYEDEKGFHYLIDDKKDKDTGKYRYLLINFNENGKVKELNYQYFRDTK